MVKFDPDEASDLQAARLCLILHKTPSEIENETNVPMLMLVYDLWELERIKENEAAKKH